jgi:phosphate transport system substrate-binding protein
MTMNARFTAMIMSFMLPLAAGAAGAGAPAPQGAGKVMVDGSSTVYRISQAAQLRFSKKVSDKIQVDVANHGTSGGFSRYMQGEVDIVDASRDAKPEETSQAKQKGYDWTRYLVGYDGITIVVNPRNTWVKSLTTEQLRRLFAVDSKVKTWKDLDAKWPEERIKLYAPDTDSGTFEYFVEAILKTKEKAQRKEDVNVSPNDNVLVNGVANDKNGLGYFGYAYYVANEDRLKAVPIDNGKGPVAPDRKTILSKTYAPLSRPLYIFVKDSSFKRPEVAQFVTFYVGNIAALSKAGGYVPPTAEDIEANHEALDHQGEK